MAVRFVDIGGMVDYPLSFHKTVVGLNQSME
jgi:hypothetical protein